LLILFQFGLDAVSSSSWGTIWAGVQRPHSSLEGLVVM